MSQLQLEREQQGSAGPTAAPDAGRGPAAPAGAAHDAGPTAAGGDAAHDTPAGGAEPGDAAGAWEADDGLMDAMGLGDDLGDENGGNASSAGQDKAGPKDKAGPRDKARPRTKAKNHGVGKQHDAMPGHAAPPDGAARAAAGHGNGPGGVSPQGNGTGGISVPHGPGNGGTTAPSAAGPHRGGAPHPGHGNGGTQALGPQHPGNASGPTGGVSAGGQAGIGPGGVAAPGGAHGTPVQKRDHAGAAGGVDGIHDTAAAGIGGTGGALPHRDAIQASFGRHDVTGVSAHTDSAAATATQAMGAEAYATGNSVAFGSPSPSLHTAAHEAAHVVQQRGGVQLKGGVGEVGDAYERHADAVADQVVQGKSAEGLLDQLAPAAVGGAGGPVQAKVVQFDIKADLKQAMAGWGTDEDAIFARIERASVPEIQAVIADGALMAELRSELDRGDMERVLDGLRASVKDKLKLAMSGWGADEQYVHRTLMQASAADLAAIAADKALVDQLQGELSHDDMRRVLDRIAMPLARKLQFAIDGWGTDEAYVFQACQTAPVAEVIAVAGNAALIAQVDADFSGEELDQWRGILARRLHEAGQDLLAFKLCKGSDSARRARLVWVGDVVAQRAVCDLAITTSTDADTVQQAFQSYWEVELSVAAGAKAWPVATLQAIHSQLKLLPDQDTRGRVWRELQLTGDKDLTDRAAYGSGVFSVGDNAATAAAQPDPPKIPMGYGTKLTAAATAGATTIQVEENRFAVGDTIDLDSGAKDQETVTISTIAGTTYTISATTKAHAIDAYVGTSGGSGLRDVNWLNATVRHEIAHSVEGIVDCSGFKQGLGGWWSGGDFDTWANAMGSPWGTGPISDDDKAAIKSKIEDHVHGAKGTLTTLPADHAISRNWGIPVIAAAEACLAPADRFFEAPTTLYQANNKVFSCSAWYKVFQYCNAGVMADRLSNYTLYAAAEFFAETYTVFYEEAGVKGVTDAQLGRHIKNAGWASWIRTYVHERGHAPAVPGGGGPGGPGGAPAPGAAAGDKTTAAVTPGDGRPGGASHGRKANNPN